MRDIEIVRNFHVACLDCPASAGMLGVNVVKWFSGSGSAGIDGFAGISRIESDDSGSRRESSRIRPGTADVERGRRGSGQRSGSSDRNIFIEVGGRGIGFKIQIPVRDGEISVQRQLSGNAGIS